MDYLFLIAGFIALLISGEFLVRGGASLAKNFRVSDLVIGVTVVSLGTSAPELVVSVDAALTGHPAIAIGNIVGSNISNIALVLGIVTTFMVIQVRKDTIYIDWPIMMLASILFYIFILDRNLEFWQGLFFVICLLIFIVWSIMRSRKANQNAVVVKSRYPVYVSILLVIGSSAGLVLGANLLVRGAAGVAESFGISEHAISVTVVALGTSLPELATSLMAAIRKRMDISVGNIVGSNIFNLFGILGVTAMVKPIPVEKEVLDFDIFWLLGTALLLFLFMYFGRKRTLNRLHGISFLVIYLLYVYFILLSR
jgi:cation:H+ antiporter